MDGKAFELLKATVVASMDPIRVEEAEQIAAMLLPQGFTIGDMTAFHKRPRRLQASARFLTAESFMEYWRKFVKPGGGRVVAKIQALALDPESGRMTAPVESPTLLGFPDYHEGPDAPTWAGDHKVRLDLEISEQFKAWMARIRKPFTQQDFANFLEDRLLDLQEPKPAELLKLVCTVRAIKRARFESGINLSRGTMQLEYKEDVTNARGGKLEIPETFKIAIPLFRFGERVTIDGRLRVEIGDAGSFSVMYLLNNVSELWDREAYSTLADVAGKIKLPLAIGELAPV